MFVTYYFFMKGKRKTFCFLVSKLTSIVLFLTSCFFIFADESLISVVTSRNENVSYVNIAPLYYEAKRKGFDLIQVSPGDFKNRKPGELKPMELIIYSTCNRGNPQKEAALGFRSQFLLVNFLMSPHPDDLPAAYYLLPAGLFRMFKEVLRGHPYFYEKGIVRIVGVHNKVWEVDIQRSDVTAVNSKTDYSVSFSQDADQPLFIQALKSAAKPAKSQVPQVTVLLESLNLYVRATYALIHKGSRQYQPVKTMNILNWWSKQQKWCPVEFRKTTSKS